MHDQVLVLASFSGYMLAGCFGTVTKWMQNRIQIAYLESSHFSSQVRHIIHNFWIKNAKVMNYSSLNQICSNFIWFDKFEIQNRKVIFYLNSQLDFEHFSF